MNKLSEETAEKRRKRGEIRRKLAEINPIGKRIVFLREKLGLTLSQVADSTGIPISCLADREANKRTAFYEEILTLAFFFNIRWQKKYLTYFPSFGEYEVREVTPMFILFGEDPTMENMREIIKQQQEDFRRRELEALEEKLELRAQLDMFMSDKNQQQIRDDLKKEQDKIKQSKTILGFDVEKIDE